MTSTYRLEEIYRAAYGRYIGWLGSFLMLAFAVAGGLTGGLFMNDTTLATLSVVTAALGAMSVRTFVLYRKANTEWFNVWMAEVRNRGES